MGEKATTERRSSGWLKPLLFLVVVGGILVAGRIFGIGERIAEARTWIESLGAWGPVVYIVLYALAVTVAIPASALSVIGGAMFGSLLGVVYVSIAATLGASLAFLAARYFVRDLIARRFADNRQFQRLDRLTESHGAIIVALTRLVPLFPFNLLNYGFGLTRVPFWTYVFWSWLCMLPGTVLYVVGADAITTALAEGAVPWALIGIVAVVVGLLIVLVRNARRRLIAAEHVPDAEEGER